MELNKILTLILVNLFVYYGYIVEALEEYDEYEEYEDCQENGEICGDNFGMCCTENASLACDLDIGSSSGICHDTYTHCVGLGKPCISGFQDAFRCCEDDNIFCDLYAPQQEVCAACKGLNEPCNDQIKELMCCPNKNLTCQAFFQGPPIYYLCRPYHQCVGLGMACGGTARVECCKGQNLTCQVIINPDDKNNQNKQGTCVKDCSGWGEFCGGMAGIACCEGENLICKLDSDSPDASGNCDNK